ncbi:MAG: purple acid phosphatase family protein [Promethearchaeota archaeon]
MKRQKKNNIFDLSPKNIFLVFIKKIILIIIFGGIIAGSLYSYYYDYYKTRNYHPPVLTWATEEPSTTITIQWETLAPTDTLLKYGKTPQLELDAVYNSTVTKFHVVTLQNLEPNTKYYYRAMSKSGLLYGISDLYSFKTASPDNSPLDFVVYGDTRDEINGYTAVVNGILNLDSKPDFVFHVGDLVGAGGDRWLWNQFFHRSAPLFATIPLIPIIGNHEYYSETTQSKADSDFPGTEYMPEHYFKYFNLPGNERYYSYNISFAHFIVLDDAVPGGVFYSAYDPSAERNKQVQWLYDDLIKVNSTYKWIFVLYHVPEDRNTNYTINTEHGTRVMTVNQIYHESGVDMVLLGHYHTYERQMYTFEGRTIPYVITGGGGADLDGSFRWSADECSVQYCVYNFVQIKLNKTELSMIAYDYNGFKIDSLKLNSEGAIL